MIRRIVLNAFALISGQVAVKGLGLLWLVVLARHLGESGFGYLNFALSLAGIFSVLVELGLSPVLTRAVARDSALGQTYLANVLGLRLLLAAAAIPLTVVVSLFTGAEPGALAPVVLIAVTMLTSGLFSIPNALFVARERMRFPALVQTGSKVAAVAVGILFVRAGLALPWIAFVFLLEGLLNVAVGFPLMRRVLGYRVRIALDVSFCRELVRDALPFALTIALGLLYFKLDAVMLSAMKGSGAVGWYSAAFRLLEGLVYVSAAFVGALFPTLSRLETTDPATLRVTVRRAAEVVVAVSLPAACAIALLAPGIVSVLYGPEYRESVAALRWIGAALFFVFLNNFLGSVLGAVDRQPSYFRVTLAGVVLNVSLNLALIPSHAHVGAAVATVITQAAVLALLTILVARHVRPGHDALRLGKIALATAVLAAVLVALREAPLGAAAGLGALSYLGALAAARVLTAEERREIAAAFRGTGGG